MIYCISIYIDNSGIVFARRFFFSLPSPHTFIYLYWIWWMISLISIHVITSIWWMRFSWHWSILLPRQNTFEICTRLWFHFYPLCISQYLLIPPPIIFHLWFLFSHVCMCECEYYAYTCFHMLAMWRMKSRVTKKDEHLAANSVPTPTKRFLNNVVSHI